jgi:hypothetical protein
MMRALILLSVVPTLAMSQPPRRDREVNIPAMWASAGVGAATVDPGGMLTTRIAIAASHERLIGIGRLTSASDADDSIYELALLAGVRTRGKSFLHAAGGFGRGVRHPGCGASCSQSDTRAIVAAVDLGAHGIVSAFGLGANLFASLGDSHVSFAGLGFSFELGRFGR